MTIDEERWAETLLVQKQHGDDALGFVASRIAHLAAAGDRAGVDRWTAIAERLDQLTSGTIQ